MAIWKITCPDCNHCEEVRIDIDDFSEKEQKEFLNKHKQKEIILRIPFDEMDKLRYALDHVQQTSDEHIDAVLDTFNQVLKEEIDNYNKEQPRFECGEELMPVEAGRIYLS